MKKLYYFTPQTDYETPSSVMTEITHTLEHTSRNVYGTPSSMSKVTETPVAADAQEFYVVSTTKFLVLYIATLGLYNIYWFYKNWKLHKQQTGKKVIPFLRAIFPIFFTHSLFGAVQSKLKAKGQSFKWEPGILATVFIVLGVASNYMGIYSLSAQGSPWPAIAILMLLVISALVLSQAQAAINYASGDPKGSSNKSFSLANIVWILIGSVILFLNIFGIFMLLAGTLS